MEQLILTNKLVSEQLLPGSPLYQCYLDVSGGEPVATAALKSFIDLIPREAHWSAFGISRMQMPMVAQSMLLDAHCRVGLEDNLYLSHGVSATNTQLVEKAIVIIKNLAAHVMPPVVARSALGLRTNE